MDKYSILKRYFGHANFRPGQEELIDAILLGRDALGIMPTGGGKSLCYQIPALLFPGVTLVISPLISLMKDQVTALRKSGINAAFINSSLSAKQLHLIYSQAQKGKYKFLYVAPERLGSESFSALTQAMPVSLVAVDEAHCISQWGQDFRPSYLKISDFIASLPRRPVVAAFTATATSEVQKDIIRLLKLNDPVCILAADIDISALREFQTLDYSLQKDMGSFKPTPPDFDRRVLEMKRNGTLFEWIMETYC